MTTYKETDLNFIASVHATSKEEHIEMMQKFAEDQVRFDSHKTVEVNRKYRPKFQWPLKHKDYGDESLK